MKYLTASSLSFLLLQLLLVVGPTSTVAGTPAHPPPAHAGGSGGGGSSSSSGGSSNGSSSSSGGSSGSSSSSSGGSSGSSSGSSSASQASRSSTGSGGSSFMDRLLSGDKAAITGAIIAAAVVAAIVAMALFAIFAKKKKRKPEQLEKSNLAMMESGLLSSATTDSGDDSVEIIPTSHLTKPTSGLYKSIDTELQIKFGTPNDLGYKISGSGYQKVDEDSHMDAIAITITKGYAPLDGSKAWWIEERKPFIDTRQPKNSSACPRPKCSFNNCRAAPGAEGIPRTFSVDGQTVHTVKCTGDFNYEQNTFDGSWTRINKNGGLSDDIDDDSGIYMLSLDQQGNGPSNLKGINESGEGERLSPRKRLMKNVWSLFGKKR